MTSTSLPQQQQEAFTFASPISSETYEDALDDFDYPSWIEQSKISSQSDKLWTDNAEAIYKNHREMLQRAVQDLPEEAYEMSLRDLTKLPLSRATTKETASSTPRQNSNKKPRRKKKPSMEGAGVLIKLFMSSPSRSAAPGRKKSFPNSTVRAVSVISRSMEKATSEEGNEPSNTRSNSMPIKSYQDCTNRKSMGCYPFFNSRKYKAKQVAGGHFCR